jgi:ferredoxin
MSDGTRVEVDRELCCGAGQCALIAPEVFDQDEDDGLVLLLASSPEEGSEKGVREAAAVCPTGAITLLE